MNSWSKNFYHDPKGKVLGSISEYNGQYKAVLDKFFIGWYISEEYAQRAVEEAYRDAVEEQLFNDLS